VQLILETQGAEVATVRDGAAAVAAFGADLHLPKPITAAALLAGIAAVLGG
jgi:DNA-binding response OmpR family regulator